MTNMTRLHHFIRGNRLRLADIAGWSAIEEPRLRRIVESAEHMRIYDLYRLAGACSSGPDSAAAASSHHQFGSIIAPWPSISRSQTSMTLAVQPNSVTQNWNTDSWISTTPRTHPSIPVAPSTNRSCGVVKVVAL